MREDVFFGSRLGAPARAMVQPMSGCLVQCVMLMGWMTSAPGLWVSTRVREGFDIRMIMQYVPLFVLALV